MMKPLVLGLFIEVTAFALGATFVPSGQYLLWLWVAVGVHVLLVLWVFRNGIRVFWLDHLHIGYKIIKKGEEQLKAEEVRKQNARREKMAARIRAMTRFGFLGEPMYDASTRTVKADIQFQHTWKESLMRYATWLVDHKLLSMGICIEAGKRLGYRYNAPTR